jgi:hypothetical protein
MSWWLRLQVLDLVRAAELKRYQLVHFATVRSSSLAVTWLVTLRLPQTVEPKEPHGQTSGKEKVNVAMLCAVLQLLPF